MGRKESFRRKTRTRKKKGMRKETNLDQWQHGNWQGSVWKLRRLWANLCEEKRRNLINLT